MNLKGIENIVILGSGESGVGAAILAKKNDFNVFVSDLGKIKPVFKNELIQNDIAFEENNHDSKKILTADLIIKSPGITDDAPLIIESQKKDIPVISEIEFAYYFNNAKIVSVTGSNGKTTTTHLIHQILKNAGLNVTYGGNIGISFARKVAYEEFDYIVLEISSFQLDYIKYFKSDIAILLNITPDHLDRYSYDIDKYAKSKMKIADNQTEQDLFIYNYDDNIINQYLKKKQIKSKMIPISQKSELTEGIYLEDKFIHIVLNKNSKLKVNMNILSLIGKHNLYNSMAASAAAKALDVQDEIIRNSLANFDSIEHRLESVAKIQGIEFINDSKATNVNATWYALECMSKSVIWIAGGIDKGNNYEEIRHLVVDKVKAIICLGVDNKKIMDAFSNDIQLIFDTPSIKEAVKIAFKLARREEVVLLSPACASFDLFENYEDRGNQFKLEVRNL